MMQLVVDGICADVLEGPVVGCSDHLVECWPRVIARSTNKCAGGNEYQGQGTSLYT